MEAKEGFEGDSKGIKYLVTKIIAEKFLCEVKPVNLQIDQAYRNPKAMVQRELL